MFPQASSDKHTQNNFPVQNILGTSEKYTLKGDVKEPEGWHWDLSALVSKGKETSAATGDVLGLLVRDRRVCSFVLLIEGDPEDRARSV